MGARSEFYREDGGKKKITQERQKEGFLLVHLKGKTVALQVLVHWEARNSSSRQLYCPVGLQQQWSIVNHIVCVIKLQCCGAKPHSRTGFVICL